MALSPEFPPSSRAVDNISKDTWDTSESWGPSQPAKDGKVFQRGSITSVLDIDKDLSTLFTRQARATPDAIALEDDRTTLTYANLDKRVASLARRLRGFGVKRDSLVGVLFPRSADYVIACLAALRAGGAFLVLELAYPAELLADVIDDSKPVAIITQTQHARHIQTDVPLILLDGPEPAHNEYPHEQDDSERSAVSTVSDDLEKLAFVCYTSGTTGRPKGICNPHRAAVRSYDQRFRLNDVRPGDRVACNAFFIWEMLRPLLRGATVVAVPDEASYDPLQLVDLLASRRITETLMTPTLLASILSRNPQLQSRLPDLRTLWLNGEVVTTDLARRAIKALPEARLLNCYSASETHEIACGDIREMVDDDASYCPVGPPLDPEHTYVLDQEGRHVGVGISGELSVGGSLLARGYLNLPEITAKAFKPDPYDPTPGAIIYRTGDEAKLLPSGLLEITGRVGGMLKVRGYSVVPGKVESVILRELAVSHCAVVAQGDGLERQLVVYFVRDGGDSGERTVPEISETGFSPNARRTLSASLALYMIPALWVELPALPTNDVSGKVDLKRLPPPKSPVFSSGTHTPLSVLEDGRTRELNTDSIAEIWSETLGAPLSAITQEHDFFDLGGHSLALADLANKLSTVFGFSVPVAKLAGAPSLMGHLEVLRCLRDGRSATAQPDLSAVLRADCMLDQDIQPMSKSMCSLHRANTILLTGATGFLGAFLLNQILESTSAQILCLVRFDKPSEDDKAAGVVRLRRTLLDLGLWRDAIMDRVEILPANLAKRMLGLAPCAFDELAARVDVIVHAAAAVNLVYPYSALRPANVVGTHEILRFACRGGATLQYISTNGVLPARDEAWPEETMIEIDSVAEKIPDGYGQTKYVAEQLVHEAGRRGLPVRIFRPGTISGHSTSGSTNARDLLSALIVESLHLGAAPEIQGWRAEMTPVDFVSKAVVTISNNADTNRRIFHLGDRKPISTNELFDSLEKLGYPTRRLDWDEWLALWTNKRATVKCGDGACTVDILRSGLPYVEFLKNPILLDDASTLPLLGGIDRPRLGLELLEVYARHWFARGWLPRIPSRKDGAGAVVSRLEKGHLFGRVAVVTGASSGIGAAVAVCLAREGAHVVLAARRRSALESTKHKCELVAGSRGSRILIQETDVTEQVQVANLMRIAAEALGPVDILVSCAGVMYFTLMANAQTDEWERTVDINCKGLLYCLAAAVPPMLAHGSGHVVAISSDAGRKVFPGLGVYSASKFFVEAALQSLRLETAGTGLRVTSVQPGNTATDLLHMSSDTEAVKKYGEPSGAQILDPENVAESIIYALRQPAHVSVNEVLIEPRDEPI